MAEAEPHPNASPYPNASPNLFADPPGGPPSGAKRRRGRWWLIGALVVVIAVGAGAAVTVSRRHSSGAGESERVLTEEELFEKRLFIPDGAVQPNIRPYTVDGWAQLFGGSTPEKTKDFLVQAGFVRAVILSWFGTAAGSGGTMLVEFRTNEQAAAMATRIHGSKLDCCFHDTFDPAIEHAKVLASNPTKGDDRYREVLVASSRFFVDLTFFEPPTQQAIVDTTGQQLARLN